MHSDAGIKRREYSLKQIKKAYDNDDGKINQLHQKRKNPIVVIPMPKSDDVRRNEVSRDNKDHRQRRERRKRPFSVPAHDPAAKDSRGENSVDDDPPEVPQGPQAPCSICNAATSTEHRHPVFPKSVCCRRCAKKYTVSQVRTGYICSWCLDAKNMMCACDCKKGFCKPCFSKHSIPPGYTGALEDEDWKCPVCTNPEVEKASAHSRTGSATKEPAHHPGHHAGVKPSAVQRTRSGGKCLHASAVGVACAARQAWQMLQSMVWSGTG